MINKKIYSVIKLKIQSINHKKYKQKGFTLVEVIVYMLIHTILVTQILAAVLQTEKVWNRAQKSINDYVKSLPSLVAPQGFISLAFVIVTGFIMLTLSIIHSNNIKTLNETIFLYMYRKEVYMYEVACINWVRNVYGQNIISTSEMCKNMAKDQVLTSPQQKIDQYFK